MKKLIALLLAAVMVLGLVACGGSEAPAATEAPAANDAPAAAAPAEMTEAEKAAAEAEIRYAISLLFDRNYIVEEIGQAGQVPASSFVPMGMTDADGSQFYHNAGTSADFFGYYNVAAEAYEDNYAEAYEILTKYYEVDANGMLTNFPPLPTCTTPPKATRLSVSTCSPLWLALASTCSWKTRNGTPS